MFIHTMVYGYFRFIYYDEVNLNGEVVMGCMHASKKYQLQGLASRCETFLKQHISTSNVCTIHEQANFYDVPQLVNQCMEYITQNAKQVFANDDVLVLSATSMLSVLDRELQMEEMEVFTAVKRWAEHQCRLANKKPTGDVLRQYLGPILFKVRFPVLSNTQFVQHVSPTGILTLEEELTIFRHLADPQNVTTVGQFSCVAIRNRYRPVSAKKSYRYQ